MNTATALMSHVSAAAAELSQKAHTAYYIGCSGRSDDDLRRKIERDFERLANLMGADVTFPARRENFTNTAPSERGLSAEDRADRDYQQGREEWAS